MKVPLMTSVTDPVLVAANIDEPETRKLFILIVTEAPSVSTRKIPFVARISKVPSNEDELVNPITANPESPIRPDVSQMKSPKFCPRPVGIVVVVPVTRHSEASFHAAVGITPPSLL